LTLHFIKNPQYLRKCLKEIEEIIVKPYLRETEGAEPLCWKPTDIIKMLDFENMAELEYTGYCFNEALRMQPPVYSSSSVSMMETADICGTTLRKGDAISIDMYRLGMNPKEWREPERFLPERFNPKSEYYLTPEGKKRNPASFSPFLGGQRICLGKTFVEMVSKITMPAFFCNFEIALANGQDPDTFKMPANNLLCTREPDVHVSITRRPASVPIAVSI